MYSPNVFRTFYSYSYFVPGIFCLLKSLNKNLSLSKPRFCRWQRKRTQWRTRHELVSGGQSCCSSRAAHFCTSFWTPSFPFRAKLAHGTSRVCLECLSAGYIPQAGTISSILMHKFLIISSTPKAFPEHIVFDKAYHFTTSNASFWIIS